MKKILLNFLSEDDIDKIYKYIRKISQIRYNRYLKRVNKRKKKKRAKIIFMVVRPGLWNSYRTVFENAKKCPQIDATICISPSHYKGKWMYKQGTIDFYKKTDKNAVVMYDETHNKWKSLKKMHPDYVFYDYPYRTEFCNKYFSATVMKYAKVCFVPYGFILTNSNKLLNVVFPDSFFRNCYLFFASWSIAAEYLKNRHRLYKYTNRKIECLGYPRFDLIENKKCNNSNYTSILYTPRHNLPWEYSNDGYCHSTFLDYKDRILNRCKSHPEEYWIIRPHPLTFEKYVSNNVITQQELNELKEEIMALPNAELDEDGNYMNSIKRADIIVTDFSSLIVEYFYAGSTIVYTGVSKAIPVQEINEGIYSSASWEDTVGYIESIKGGNDYKKRMRETLCKNIGIATNNKSGERIIDYIIKDYYGDVRRV